MSGVSLVVFAVGAIAPLVVGGMKLPRWRHGVCLALASMTATRRRESP
jgi:hypothetical protein